MGSTAIDSGGVEWIILIQVRDKWQAVVNDHEPSGSIKCVELLDYRGEVSAF